MKKQFVDFGTAKKLKKIGFDEDCMAHYENMSKLLVVNYNNFPLVGKQKKRPLLYKMEHKNSTLPQWAISAPTWEQVEQWMWDNHKIEIISTSSKDRKIWCGGWKNNNVFDSTGNKFNSPILAKTEGVKQAVIYLHKQQKL